MKIQIKVITNASKNQILPQEDGSLKITCTQTPERGKANQAILAMLAEYYHVPKSHIKILRGKYAAKKQIEIIT